MKTKHKTLKDMFVAYDKYIDRIGGLRDTKTYAHVEVFLENNELETQFCECPKTGYVETKICVNCNGILDEE